MFIKKKQLTNGAKNLLPFVLGIIKKEKEKKKEPKFQKCKDKVAKILDFENGQFYMRVKYIFLPYCL